MTWSGLPNSTRNWIALGGAVIGVAGAIYGFGRGPTDELTAQVRGNTDAIGQVRMVSDSALSLARENRTARIQDDSLRAADREILRRIDRTLCRQIATSERELRDCDSR